MSGGYLRATFEQMTRDNNLKPLDSVRISPGVDLLLAEGQRQPDSEMNEVHWLVTWALTRGEKVVEASVVRIPYYTVMPLTQNVTATYQQDRIKVARKHAQHWIDNAKKVGWL